MPPQQHAKLPGAQTDQPVICTLSCHPEVSAIRSEGPADLLVSTLAEENRPAQLKMAQKYCTLMQAWFIWKERQEFQQLNIPPHSIGDFYLVPIFSEPSGSRLG